VLIDQQPPALFPGYMILQYARTRWLLSCSDAGAGASCSQWTLTQTSSGRSSWCALPAAIVYTDADMKICKDHTVSQRRGVDREKGRYCEIRGSVEQISIGTMLMNQALNRDSDHESTSRRGAALTDCPSAGCSLIRPQKAGSRHRPPFNCADLSTNLVLSMSWDPCWIST
jgi:hypothetical protein